MADRRRLARMAGWAAALAAWAASGLMVALLGLGAPFVLAQALAAGCAGLAIWLLMARMLRD